MTITDLPLDLLLLVVEYLEDGAFVFVNRSLARVLARKVRRIAVRTSNPRWQSNEIRSKLLQMIENPHSQLSLTVDSKVEPLTQLFFLSGVNCLRVHQDFPFDLSILVNQVQAQHFILKNLYINGMEFSPFSSFPFLELLSLTQCNIIRSEELKIPAFTSLRSLKLVACLDLEDVSCLDGIHDLMFVNCPKIQDISSLNNNQHVSMTFCDGIRNYSKSFHSTRSLTLQYCSSEALIALENCSSLSSLSIISKSFAFSNNYMSSLRFLVLSTVQNIKALPPNRLQSVDISYCEDFESFKNMENIRSVRLTGLMKITSLDGLGPKNQIISLIGMENLQDISSLESSTIVSIQDCYLLEDHISSSLLHVKELKLRYLNCFLPSYIDSMRKLQELKDLRVLEIEIDFPFEVDWDDDIRSLVFLLHRVEKFVLSGELFAFADEEFKKEFSVERKMILGYPREVVLLRKRR